MREILTTFSGVNVEKKTTGISYDKYPSRFCLADPHWKPLYGPLWGKGAAAGHPPSELGDGEAALGLRLVAAARAAALEAAGLLRSRDNRREENGDDFVGS